MSLLPFLEEVFDEISDGTERTFVDIFAGTGAVGRHFKGLGLKVLANDLQYYSFVLNKAYLEINRTPAFDNLRNVLGSTRVRQSTKLRVEQLMEFLNSLPVVEGFISLNYGPVGGRMYYTEANAGKADAIRQTIGEWRTGGLLLDSEFYYLLCSLLEAIDEVANTASVYGAYLKSFKTTAKRELRLKPLELTNHVKGCKVWNIDAAELIRQVECDVLYLDPPYNQRQYGANYHVLETIAAYDAPALKGVTGLRDYRKSDYCRRKSAGAAMQELINAAKAKHILISYNDEGVLTLNEIQALLASRGEPRLFQTSHNRFKADSGRTYKRNGTTEYVHYVRVVR